MRDTLVRAEALWRRFRGLVEMVDGRKERGLGGVAGKKEGEEAEEEGKELPVISEELRRLLSTEIIRP